MVVEVIVVVEAVIDATGVWLTNAEDISGKGESEGLIENNDDGVKGTVVSYVSTLAGPMEVGAGKTGDEISSEDVSSNSTEADNTAEGCDNGIVESKSTDDISGGGRKEDVDPLGDASRMLLPCDRALAVGSGVCVTIAAPPRRHSRSTGGPRRDALAGRAT